MAREESGLEKLEFSRNKRPEDSLLSLFFHFSSIMRVLLPFSICFFSYDDAGKLWKDDGLQAGGHCTQLPPLRDLPTRILSRTDVDFTKKEQAAGLVPFLIDDTTGSGSYRLKYLLCFFVLTAFLSSP